MWYNFPQFLLIYTTFILFYYYAYVHINSKFPEFEHSSLFLGVYVTSGCKLTRSEFHDMGIRIEDDVLIKNSGAEVISNAVKTPNDIEKICKSGS